MPEPDFIDNLLNGVVRDYDSQMHKLGCFGDPEQSAIVAPERYLTDVHRSMGSFGP